MEMIIGGAYQGKTEYARKQYPQLRWSDGGSVTEEELMNAQGVIGFQQYIRRELENGKDVSAGIQLPKDMSLLSPPFDYSTEKLSADADEIARYLRTYQKWKSAAIPSEHEIIFSA